jgi:hypothetical protein
MICNIIPNGVSGSADGQNAFVVSKSTFNIWKKVATLQDPDEITVYNALHCQLLRQMGFSNKTSCFSAGS